MKTSARFSRFIAALVLSCFLPNVALAGNRPYVPAAVSSVTGGMFAARQVSAIMWRASAISGVFGEKLMHNYFNRGLDLASGKRWHSLTQGAVKAVGKKVILLRQGTTTPQGLDGVFIEVNSKGDIKGIMVSESKFGGSQQGMTKTGVQGSKTYNAARLEPAAKNYQRLANKIEKGGISRVSSRMPKGADTIKLPISDKESIILWWDEPSKSYRHNSDVTPEKLKSQARKIAQYLQGAAEGRIDYRSRLFRTKITNGKFDISIDTLDVDGKIVENSKVGHISGSYEELPQAVKKMLKEALISTRAEFYMNNKKNGLPEADAIKRAESDVKSAEKHGKMAELVTDTKKNLAFDWRGNNGRMALYSGLIAVGFSVVFSVSRSLWNGDAIDYRGLARDATLSFASAGGGVYAGLFTTHIISKHMLTSSKSLLSKMLPGLSGVAGALVASAIFSYGYALWNGGSLSDGNRMMVTSVAMSGVGWAAGQGISWTLGALGIGGKLASVLGFAGPVAAVILAGHLYTKYEEYRENNRRLAHLRTLVYSCD